MATVGANHEPWTRLSGEDLSFWWVDSPMQPTTMAMLMLLDRAPDQQRLADAFGRALTAVPRLRERVVEAPFNLTLPHWETDPTFDLDYHVRRHALSGKHDLEELLREIAPTYETPFDRSRPLWEARIFDGFGSKRQSALFFKLHHAVADGVGGNAILAALTDCERDPDRNGEPHFDCRKGCWEETAPLAQRFIEALQDRAQMDLQRAGAAATAVADAVMHPEKLRAFVQGARTLAELAQFDSHSPLKERSSRARRLSVTSLPFDEVRAAKRQLGGPMIAVILTIMARAIGKWYSTQGISGVRELMTLVPVNLRKPEEWVTKAAVGNVATGLMVELPLWHRQILPLFRDICHRVETKKADPLLNASPLLAEAMSVLPRPLFSWMSEATFGNIDFIVTNVPGIPVERFLAGAEITAAYPFAPVAIKSPVSVALYGYRDRLFIGLNSDDGLMPDVQVFKDLIEHAFKEVRRAARDTARIAERDE